MTSVVVVVVVVVVVAAAAGQEACQRLKSAEVVAWEVAVLERAMAQKVAEREGGQWAGARGRARLAAEAVVDVALLAAARGDWEEESEAVCQVAAVGLAPVLVAAATWGLAVAAGLLAEAAAAPALMPLVALEMAGWTAEGLALGSKAEAMTAVVPVALPGEGCVWLVGGLVALAG